MLCGQVTLVYTIIYIIIIHTPKPCAEKTMATSGDNSDFPSSSGTSGYSGGESDSLTAESSVTSSVICCTVVLKGL